MKPHYRVAPLDASRIRFLFSPSNNFYSLERQSNICFQLQGSVKVTSGWDIFWPLKHYLKQWIPFVFFLLHLWSLVIVGGLLISRLFSSQKEKAASCSALLMLLQISRNIKRAAPLASKRFPTTEPRTRLHSKTSFSRFLTLLKSCHLMWRVLFWPEGGRRASPSRTWHLLKANPWLNGPWEPCWATASLIVFGSPPTIRALLLALVVWGPLYFQGPRPLPDPIHQVSRRCRNSCKVILRLTSWPLCNAPLPSSGQVHICFLGIPLKT